MKNTTEKQEVMCNVCGNSQGNQVHVAEEMMLGTRDRFDYLECGNCGCIHILTVPSDFSKYYPSAYYSLTIDPASKYKPFIKGNLLKIRDKYAIEGKGILGKILYDNYPEENLKSLSYLDKNKESSFLDIGCGSGRLLYSLKNNGYHNLTGIDPYLPKDIIYENGLVIKKQSIEDLNSKWDFVMMHHVFEHLTNSREVFKKVVQLLNPNGIFLLRIPIAPSFAWKKYGVNWVQLDAPRHIYIHSLKSIEILIKDLPFKIEKVIYDSMPFQFLASEQYVRNIPLWDSNSYMVDREKSIFTKKDFRHFKELSEKVNHDKEGDQVSLYIRYTGAK